MSDADARAGGAPIPGKDAAVADAAMADAALAVLRAVSVRAAVAERFESAAGEAVLRSIVDAAVVLINAEAASIALHDDLTGRLVFRVAAGERGRDVVGLAIESDQGVAGYAFSTGHPLAIGEATSDPRFGRTTAERTGYVPRSILAVPLTDDEGTIGVLEVLDRRDGAPFDLRDIETASVFARQATVAIRATRLERDTARLLGSALRSLVPDATPEEIDALVSASVDGLSGAESVSLWRLADAVARVRAADANQLEFVQEILDALARRAKRPAASRYRGGSRQ